MAAVGRKCKKSKGTILSLHSFLSTGKEPVNTELPILGKHRQFDEADSDMPNKEAALYQRPAALSADRAAARNNGKPDSRKYKSQGRQGAHDWLSLGDGIGGEKRDSIDWRRVGSVSGKQGTRSRIPGGHEHRPSQEEGDGKRSWRQAVPPANCGDHNKAKASEDSKVRHTNFGQPIKPRSNQEPVEDRPKLNLKPRTLPLPEIVVLPEVTFSSVQAINRTVPSPLSDTSDDDKQTHRVQNMSANIRIEKRLFDVRGHIEDDIAALNQEFTSMSTARAAKPAAKSSASNWRKGNAAERPPSGSDCTGPSKTATKPKESARTGSSAKEVAE